MRPEKSESGTRISFTGFNNLTQTALDNFQTEPVRRMLELLNCRLQADENQGMILLSFLDTAGRRMISPEPFYRIQTP
jgi:hypothetical protein